MTAASTAAPVAALMLNLSLRRTPLLWSQLQLHYFIAPSHPHAESTKLFCPHHEGAGAPYPIRAGGPDLWYQMALVDTPVEQSLISFAGGDEGVRDVRLVGKVGWGVVVGGGGAAQ